IQATYSRNTALAWILHVKYGMSHKAIGNGLGISAVTVKKSILNIKSKINDMNCSNIESILTEAHDIYSTKTDTDSDDEFLESVIKEQKELGLL
ncbi:MAG: hypothetical protein ACRCRT_00160, partial [Cetobacterium somerae]